MAFQNCMAIEPGNLIRLGKQDIEPAARMLARAFRDYPLLTHSVPDFPARERAAFYFCQFDLYYCIRYGVAYATSPQMEGVAAWITSDQYPMTMWGMLRSVPWSVIAGFGRVAGARLLGPGRYVDARHEALVPFRHWMLALLGVAPEFQGQGCPSALLNPMLASIDARGLPCYVETMDARNVPRYEHFGFKVIEESIIPGTDLTSWAMLRGKPPETR